MTSAAHEPHNLSELVNWRLAVT